jgi:hypothetical protein
LEQSGIAGKLPEASSPASAATAALHKQALDTVKMTAIIGLFPVTYELAKVLGIYFGQVTLQGGFPYDINGQSVRVTYNSR